MQNEKVPAAMQDNVTQAVDSGMDAETVATAELLWANLPTGRKWTSLRTDEVALVCHTVRRLASTTAQSEAVQKLVDALEGMLAHSCVADAALEDKLPEDYAAESAARQALTAHRESQP